MKAFDIHSDSKLDSDLRQVIPKNVALGHQVIPKQIDKEHYQFYIHSKADEVATGRYLQVLLGKTVAFEPIDGEVIELALSKFYGNTDRTSQETKNFDKNNFLDQLIFEAIELKSSDIHVECYEHSARVRFRINGHLVERFNLGLDNYPELVNKIKIVARLDIAEKRLPQDGRINFSKGEIDLDLRVSVLPSLYGEKVVLRLLEKNSSAIHIEDLGLSSSELAVYRRVVTKPNGLILISGPTGSGKTTTLYATLKELNQEDVNIVTIEDPVEYTLPGINQVQLNEKIGLGFPQALRTFLRQDPDIVMVGEIRDVETAQMATRAALTGHLVFSTVHTNSALGIFNRLVEMGISEYLLADTLNAGIAQRLVRVLCESCKVEAKEEEFVGHIDGLKGHRIYKAVGCVECLGTGYTGRKALYEIIPNSPGLIHQIKDQSFNLNSHLGELGLATLQVNAINFLKEGKTSVEEVLPLLI
ncbi:GspE/PulE family protein [Reichenbachiella ulvae]|uniref:GspE/PulE family protein n=1 Tax=Reichenbachiella ulvae TaxID=2980104 RepID=A0ABT3CUT0_9BACT|nr:GspE/PulE family protein [Reichenbachiella ulvae]MCV9387455.1 GspE/PulE family protein [Reichenbachiella ulvae]